MERKPPKPRSRTRPGRTPEGKAVSSGNALKLGLFAQAELLPGEDPALRL